MYEATRKPGVLFQMLSALLWSNRREIVFVLGATLALALFVLAITGELSSNYYFSQDVIVPAAP